MRQHSRQLFTSIMHQLHPCHTAHVPALSVKSRPAKGCQLMLPQRGLQAAMPAHAVCAVSAPHCTSGVTTGAATPAALLQDASCICSPSAGHSLQAEHMCTPAAEQPKVMLLLQVVLLVAAQLPCSGPHRCYRCYSVKSNACCCCCCSSLQGVLPLGESIGPLVLPGCQQALLHRATQVSRRKQAGRKASTMRPPHKMQLWLHANATRTCSKERVSRH